MSRAQQPAFARFNDGVSPLYVWLEPWAEEFNVPCGSTLELYLRGVPSGTLEIDEEADQITVWAPSGALVDAVIDGAPQNSASAQLTVPSTRGLGTRGFVEAVFGDDPGSRPAGRPRPVKKRAGGWLRNLFRR